MWDESNSNDDWIRYRDYPYLPRTKRASLTGMRCEFPLANASLTDCVFEVLQPTNVEEVNRMLSHAAQNELEGILGYEGKAVGIYRLSY